MVIGASLLAGTSAMAEEFKNEGLQVWSCGGLAEAFIPANKAFEKKTGSSIAYTGAFAGALGKSLLANSTTEIFAPRVLGLAKKLKEQGKMLYFKPLCFTRYVVATPKGNPAGIKDITDLGEEGVRTVITPDASPPGGKASMGIMKKAGVLDAAQKNAVTVGDCVQTAISDLASGKANAAVVEQRIIRLPQFEGKFEQIQIPEEFIPSDPVPFTIGVMKWAKNKKLADAFIEYILSDEGQAYFDKAGFIPARSEEGQRLITKYGVNDA